MYTITPEDIISIDEKLENQRYFLSIHNLNSHSANLNPKKYFAECNNRVNTITHKSLQQGLKPVFITITLPSAYHPKSKHYEGHTIKESSLYLSDIWRSLLRSNLFKNTEYHYVKTVEPHESGVPHLHALFFINVTELDKFGRTLLERFETAFVKAMNKRHIKQYKFKTTFEGKHYTKDSLKAVVAYIMKYINKSFRNAKTGKMDYVTYWFVKYRIRRLSTSRSHIPLGIYRNINYIPALQNMKTATYYYDSKYIVLSEYKTFIEWRYFDEYEGLVQDHVWCKPFKEKAYTKPKMKEKYQSVPCEIDGKMYSYDGYRLRNFGSVYPAELSDLDLYNYYHDIKNKDVSDLHFAITYNEMVKRDLLQSRLIDLNSLTQSQSLHF